jgi:SAM-dependent methyltransferase
MQNPDLGLTVAAPAEAGVPRGQLSETLNSLEIGRAAEASWRDLKAVILGLIDAYGAKRLLEIGGGRFPYLSREDVETRQCELTVNDILEDELARAPAAFHKACFDISSPFLGEVVSAKYDFIFSRMVFEHVRDGRQAWSNCLKLLNPGGIAFAFVPTLWSPPFVANRLVPEGLSTRLLQMIDANRTPELVPKFPAYYDLCRGDVKVLEPILHEVGFSDVAVVPFFGTPYFPVVPVVKHLARAFDRVIDAFDIKAFSSYAYIIARK